MCLYSDRSLIEKNDHRNRRHCVIRNEKAVRTCSRSWIPRENHFRQNVPCSISVKFLFSLLSPLVNLTRRSMWAMSLSRNSLRSGLYVRHARRVRNPRPGARPPFLSLYAAMLLRFSDIKQMTTSSLCVFLKTELNYLKKVNSIQSFVSMF